MRSDGFEVLVELRFGYFEALVDGKPEIQFKRFKRIENFSYFQQNTKEFRNQIFS
jgi:hypothetical protein